MSDCCDDNNTQPPEPQSGQPINPIYINVMIATLLTGLSYGAPYFLASPYATHVVALSVVLASLPLATTVARNFKAKKFFTVSTLMLVAPLGALFVDAHFEAIMVLFLYYIGEAVENFASFKAKSGMQALLSLRPDTVRRIQSGEYEDIPIEAIEQGDIIEVHPGERIALDGIVKSGTATLDQSSITGESMPVTVHAGSQVYGGALVSNAPLKITVTNPVGQSLIDTIIASANDTENKAEITRTVDNFARYFVPIVFVLSLLVMIIPPVFMEGIWQDWIYRGLTLLLICCPCALVISTPAATSSAMAIASRMGVLFRGGVAMESIGHIAVMGMDKTGTLTTGTPVVQSVTGVSETSDKTIALAMLAESKSTHPLAHAILQYGKAKKIEMLEGTDWETIPGKGVYVDYNGDDIYVLSPTEASKKSPPAFKSIAPKIANHQVNGSTVVVVTMNDKIAGYITIADELREQSPRAIELLNKLNVKTVMLTGDNERTAQHFAQQLGMEYHAGMLPTDKVKRLQQLKNLGYVAMLGDGINDTPSLRAADVSVAMGSGTDVAMDVAHVALICNNPVQLANAIRLSRKTMSKIKQNIVIALGLKLTVLCTTLLGMTGMWIAVLADTGATVLVVLNSITLFAFKPRS